MSKNDQSGMAGFACALLLALGLLAGCGGVEIGEECDEEDVGSTGPCVEGGVCDSESGSSDRSICLAVCDADEDCGDGYHCTGVSRGNAKACHPDD